MFIGCQSTTDQTHQKVEINGRNFNLELALTEEARFQGLSGRKSIAEDGGMLFVFPTPRVAEFVMRDCLVPIDIIFLSPSGAVLTTYTMKVEPAETRSNPEKHYPSRWPCQFVIELKGGTLDELSVKTGDYLKLPLQSLKDLAQ